MLPEEVDFKGTERFEVRRRLGAGGMGVVYEAFDRERHAAVALKTLRALDEHSLYRFKNEFRALADLRHRNLVRLGELYCTAGQWFFTMELIHGTGFLAYVRSHDDGREPPREASSEGDTLTGAALAQLQAARQSGPRFDEKRLRVALEQLATAVAALHAAGMIHRDIKPSNVLVTRGGRAVLLDFGLVTDVSAGQQRTDVNVVGTAAYMSPEQGAAQPVGPPADWYSIGAVLYEALTGRPPFEGTAIDVLMAKRQGEPPAPRSLVPSAPPDLDVLCTELLRRDPRDRPTGDEVLARLRNQNTRASGANALPARTSAAHPGAAPFVGRGEELEALQRAFEDTSAGNGVILFLHGESGLGKSALVRRFLDHLSAQDEEAVILSGRCYEREEVPFKAFDGIVDALSAHLSHLDPIVAALLLSQDAALLARVFPVLRRIPAMAEVVEGRLKVPNPQEVRARAFAALRELFKRLAERSPLVLFVDDFQWADADSLALLRDVMHPPEAPSLFLVATVRTTAVASATTQALSAELRNVRHLHLSPLPANEARVLIDLLLPRDAEAAGSAAAIAKEAAGHPMFIHELVRHVAAEGVHAPGSIRLEEALWARIERIEAPARALLEAVAVAGAPMPQALAAQAAGLTEGDYGEWMTLLRLAHLVRTEGARGSDAVEPYHDRVREAVLAHLGAEERTRHHARLAQALESAGFGDHDPLALVRHFEGAGQKARAAGHAERAARLAAESLAFDRAAELLTIALRLGEHSEAEQRVLRMQLGDALVNAGRGTEAAEVYLQVVPGADTATRLECRRRAAEQLLVSGHIERGLEALSAVLADIGDRLPRTPARALASLLWQRAKLRLRGLRSTLRDESQIAPHVLTRLDVYKGVGFGLGMVDTVRGADFQIRGLLLALRTGEQRRLALAFCAEAVYYGSQGGRKIERATRLLDEARRLTKVGGGPYLNAWTEAATGIQCYFAGRYEDAIEHLRNGEQVLRDETTGTAWELTTVRLFMTQALRHVGALVELRRSYQDYVRDAIRRGDRYAETTLTRVCSFVWLAQDDVAQARKDLERSSWMPPEVGFLHLQHWYELRALAEIDLYVGTPELRPAFTVLAKSLLLRVQVVRTESRWLAARVSLARAKDAALPERARAVAEAQRVARQLDGEKMPFCHVWALLLRSGVAALREDAGAAAEMLRAAASAADENDMGLCAAVARRRLGVLLGSVGPSAQQHMGGEDGAALVAQADEWMRGEGIVNPARMADVVAPGFPPE